MHLEVPGHNTEAASSTHLIPTEDGSAKTQFGDLPILMALTI